MGRQISDIQLPKDGRLYDLRSKKFIKADKKRTRKKDLYTGFNYVIWYDRPGKAKVLSAVLTSMRCNHKMVCRTDSDTAKYGVVANLQDHQVSVLIHRGLAVSVYTETIGDRQKIFRKTGKP